MKTTPVDDGEDVIADVFLPIIKTTPVDDGEDVRHSVSDIFLPIIKTTSVNDGEDVVTLCLTFSSH